MPSRDRAQAAPHGREGTALGPGPGGGELDERKAAILEAVVTEYVASAQPVGSAHVVAAAGVRASPATVRHEMAALESEGYLMQPHTSAGRIPTDRGYRYFVDRMAGLGRLGDAERSRVRDFFAHAHGELERVLLDTSRLLSDLTNLAAVVVGPDPERTTVRSVQLVPLSGRDALLLVVHSNGSVERHGLDLAPGASDDAVERASRHLHEHLVGRRLGDHAEIAPSGDSVVDALVRDALRRLGRSDGESGPVFVGGASRMTDAFEAISTVRSVLEILEQGVVVVSLLEDLLDRGLSVAIGTEHGVEPLASCAVVVAPYQVEGERLGTVGVLGPTRMDYPRALAAVATVSRRLGQSLAER